MWAQLKTFLIDASHSWIWQVFLAVFMTVIINAIASAVLKRLQQRLETTPTVWDDAFLAAAHLPLRALMWLIGINIAANITYAHTKAPLFAYANSIREVLLIALIAWFLLRVVHEVQVRLLEPDRPEGPADATTVAALGKLVKSTVIITVAIILLQHFGYSVSGVLAFGGIGGIAIGFAAKDLLANFFGGLMIYMDRPFRVGDWIRSPDRNIEGTVENIGWRQTRIRTPDKRALYVPNSTFATISVENPSRMTHRRINEVIGLRYDDWRKITPIVDSIRAMLVEHEDIDHSQSIVVNFTQCNASSLDIAISAFTPATGGDAFAAVKQDVLLRTMQIIDDEGAEIAFPTTTVLMGSGSSPTVDSAK